MKWTNFDKRKTTLFEVVMEKYGLEEIAKHIEWTGLGLLVALLGAIYFLQSPQR